MSEQPSIDTPTVSVLPVSIPPLSDPAVFPPGFGGSSTVVDFTGGVGVGYRINDYLRLDATWDYHNGPARDRSGSVICPYGLTAVVNRSPAARGYLYDTTQTCDGFSSSKQHDNTFLGNAYVDLGTYSGFTPYVGGGLGLNINSLTQNLNFDETANGLPYVADLTPTGIAPVPAVWVNRLGLPIVPQPPINLSYAADLTPSGIAPCPPSGSTRTASRSLRSRLSPSPCRTGTGRVGDNLSPGLGALGRRRLPPHAKRDA